MVLDLTMEKMTINIQTDAGVLVTLEESPCSHSTEMSVVFVLRKKITLGSRNTNGAEKF